MKIHTIGYSNKTAEKFFDLLRTSEAATLVDVRINSLVQTGGFANRDTLKHRLADLGGMTYTHRPDLAPTPSMLSDYMRRSIDWATYEARFQELMEQRAAKNALPQELFDNTVLLCSEHNPHHCHRRLVAEYLAQHWNNVTIKHLT